MNRWVKVSLAIFAIVLAYGICNGTNLIYGWGRWYSSSNPYRRQTDALLVGSVALSSSPTALQHDLAWGRTGVQQVWGLGVPFWRLPFEAAARLFGYTSFPDRLALCFAWALMIFCVFMAFLAPAEPGTSWLAQLARHPERIGVMTMLIVFPSMLQICRGQFNVYEEPVAYGYIYSIALFAGLIAFLRRPRMGAYLALCFMSGLAGFVRPTFECYGLATMILATLLVWRGKWRWWKTLAGPAMFGLGGFLLFASNWQRFGSGFEFGHNLNLTNQDLVYTARFGAPFSHEPIWPAARELFGSLFDVLDISNSGFYGREVVGWQSPTPRWREYYEGTFDFAILAVTLLCWGKAFWRFAVTRVVHGAKNVWDSELYITAAWSILSVIPMSCFYLRFHAVSCRYWLDFAPVFGVAASGWIMVKWRPSIIGQIWHYVILAVFAVWWCWDVSAAKLNSAETGLSADILPRVMPRGTPSLISVPKRYVAGQNPQRVTGIFRDGWGWGNGNGPVYYAVTLFFDSPRKISLLVQPRSNVPYEAYQHIRAKVGLEFLKLESITDETRGKRITFAGPEKPAYQHGIQIVSLGFISPEEFNRVSSPFQLLEVSCDDTP